MITCCVCGGECFPNGSFVRDERWHCGPDGLHVHDRCKSGYAAVLRARGISVPDYVAVHEKGAAKP